MTEVEVLIVIVKERLFFGHIVMEKNKVRENCRPETHLHLTVATHTQYVSACDTCVRRTYTLWALFLWK